MDLEKLIERLRSHRGALFEMLYKQDMDDAATALSVLQAENEKLRDEAEGMRSNWYKSVEKIQKLRAELERVKRERDAVLNAFRGFIQSGHLCEYCAETLKDNPACSACEKWSKFQWRGVGEDT
uniref:E3 ubiquitin-protein ligase n=1 Tax=Myoviridae sp. ctr0w28 TaxID=2826703 RepID=A0A8S5NSI8_9CAUD|nr:MAG TPA: E3 ubiquitin-protein ligase [Myoviridae sp. ctr0w28]